MTPVTDRPGLFRARFRIIEALRGVSASHVELLAGVDYCDSRFAVGQEWLIYAFPNGTGLSTSPCTRSRHLKHALHDLAYARNAQTRTADRGRIYGRLVHAEQSRIVLLSRVRVSLHSPDRDPAIATTDEHGEFSVFVSRGIYQLRAELPPGMFLRNQPYVQLIDSRGCAEVELWAEHLAK